VSQNKIDTEVQKAMKEALSKYLQDKNSVKEFYPCMQEMTQWLKEQAK
jgi:fructose/tagatose bisphosphate aldolase